MKQMTVNAALAESARTVLVDVPSMRVVALRFEPGYALAQHHHPIADEIYSIVEGSAILEAGGRRIDVTAGDVVHLPAGEPHAFVVGDAGLVIMAVVAPNLPEHVMADGSVVGAIDAL